MGVAYLAATGLPLHEILWGDDDPSAADWVRDEFEHFWAQGVDLPDAVVKHVAAMASRIEYRSIEAARDAAGRVAREHHHSARRAGRKRPLSPSS